MHVLTSIRIYSLNFICSFEQRAQYTWFNYPMLCKLCRLNYPFSQNFYLYLKFDIIEFKGNTCVLIEYQNFILFSKTNNNEAPLSRNPLYLKIKRLCEKCEVFPIIRVTFLIRSEKVKDRISSTNRIKNTFNTCFIQQKN